MRMKPRGIVSIMGHGQSLVIQFPQQPTQLPGDLLKQSALRVILRVDGVPWKEVKTFKSCKPNDPVFVLDSQTGTLKFGDGLHGCRPPMNIQRISANYRIGSGSTGDVSGKKEQGDSGSSLYYLDIWTRDVTAIEDIQLGEHALGGPDITTRGNNRGKA